MKKTAARAPGMACPHCRSRGVVRSSEEVTGLVRELRYVCRDDDCGFAWVAQLSIVQAVRPSLKPNPSIRIPLSDWRGRFKDLLGGGGTSLAAA